MTIRLLLLMWLAAPLSAAAATIMVYGDSLSSAYGLPREQGWVALLENRLHEKRLNYTVANASVSGETTAGGRSRIDAALKTHRPAIVILALGANDGLRGLSPDAMNGNLEAIVRACRTAGAKVLLIGMRMPPNYGPAYAEKFQGAFHTLAARERVPFVPLLLDGFAEDPVYFQADGMHPTARAQPLMLETVWKALQPMLQTQGGR